MYLAPGTDISIGVVYCNFENFKIFSRMDGSRD